MWTVFGAATNSSLIEAARVEKTGFETRADVLHTLGFLRVQASSEDIEDGIPSVIGVSAAC